MKYGISNIAIMPMRDKPSDKSEMTNQVLFGEHFKVIEQEKKFSKIVLSHDGYEGWVCNKQWLEIDESRRQVDRERDALVHARNEVERGRLDVNETRREKQSPDEGGNEGAGRSSGRAPRGGFGDRRSGKKASGERHAGTSPGSSREPFLASAQRTISGSS